MIVALGELEITRPPLLVKTWRGYELTDAGERHAKALGRDSAAGDEDL